MLSSHPQVVEALKLRAVLAIQENQKELLDVVTVKLALLSEEQHKKLGDIEKNVKSIGYVLDEMHRTAKQRIADRTKTEEDRVRIAGMKIDSLPRLYPRWHRRPGRRASDSDVR